MPIKPMLHSILQLFEPYIPQSLYDVCKDALSHRVVIDCSGSVLRIVDLLPWEWDASQLAGQMFGNILPFDVTLSVNPVALAGDQDMDLGDRESLEP